MRSLREITEEVVNKQFEMIGVKFRYDDIPEDGIIEVKGKEVGWWKVYQFVDEAQWLVWRDYAKKALSERYSEEILDKKLNELDLQYGMTYPYKKEEDNKKEGQIALF